MKILINTFIITLALTIFSCKKTVNPPQTEVPNEDQLIKDSIYYYYDLYSLWADEYVPRYDKPSLFTDSFSNNQEVLTALKRFTPFYPAYDGPLDRFSYLEEQPSTINSSIQSGYGIYLSPGVVNGTEARLVIYLTDGGGPADRAGIHRGDQVLAVNGNTDFRIPVIKKDGSYTYEDEATYSRVLNNMLASLEGASLQLKIKHTDSTESTYNLQRIQYEINPILKDTIFSFPDKKIGYFAFSFFKPIDNDNSQYLRFEQLFSSFNQSNINDLIIDMRYNRGGDIHTAQYIANKIINERGDKQLMFRYGLNTYLTQLKENGDPRFADVYFERNNQLSLGTVYFLVTDITASASELLISALKPYMNVKIIAENDHTYGKPVGFFEQRIMGKVSLWPASFKLVNAQGYTDYWNGLSADQRNIADDIFRDFGDPQENMLATAINLARPNSSSVLFKRAKSTKVKLGNVNTVPQRPLLNLRTARPVQK